MINTILAAQTLSTTELIQLLSPLIALQFGLAIFCLFLIWKKGVRNLNPWIWTAIVVFLNLIGPVAFLALGRKSWTHD